MSTSQRPRGRAYKTTAYMFVFLLAISTMALFPSPKTARAAVNDFVTRCGINFCLNGKIFYYAGANSYDLFTFGDGTSSSTPSDIENKYMDKAGIDNYFANAQSDHIQVVRTWMFNHQAWHGFETAKGVYNEAEFDEFDYIIQSAKAHGIMLIPVFENYWGDYGGIDTRLQWEGLPTGQSNRWRFFNWAQCPDCFTQYKNYVNHALNHVNHYSGVAYKDDPTIFAWELMNEPRYEDATPDETFLGLTLRAWVDTMGAYVKSIDHYHMLGIGLEGQGLNYGYGINGGNPFVYIQQSPYLDYATAHFYPTEIWALIFSMSRAQDIIKAWVSDAHNAVGKPFILGEFNSRSDAPASRSSWWTALYSALEQNGADGDNFWDYQAVNTDSIYGVAHGAPELAVFAKHAQYQQQKTAAGGPLVLPPPVSCRVSYAVTKQSSGSFTANISITNTGNTTIDGWSLIFTFPGNQQVTDQKWNGVFTQNDNQVTITNLNMLNNTIAPNSSVSPGFTGSWSGSNPSPTSFQLNGSTCSMQ